MTHLERLCQLLHLPDGHVGAGNTQQLGYPHLSGNKRRGQESNIVPGMGDTSNNDNFCYDQHNTGQQASYQVLVTLDDTMSITLCGTDAT